MNPTGSLLAPAINRHPIGADAFFVPPARRHSSCRKSLCWPPGAADQNAQIAATLAEALADTTLSCALTSRRRELTSPLHKRRAVVPGVLQAAQAGN